MGSNHSLAGRSGPSVGMTCCLPGHHWLLPQRKRRHGKHLLRPTHSTLIGVSSGWVGLRLLACLLPHPFPLPPLPLSPIPAAPIPAVPIPAAPIHAADARPVRVKPALRRSTYVNKGVNPNAGNLCGDRNVAFYYCVCLLHNDRTLMA